MKYPRLPKELDNRRKLTSDQIEVIRKLSSEGWSQRKLAKEFKVSRATIFYHVVDSKKRGEINKHRYEKILEQSMSDPDYVKRKKEQDRKSYKKCLGQCLEKRIYKGKATYKWKKKKYHTDDMFREKTKKQARESYHRNK